MAILCQAINIYLLTYQHTVDHSIIHFVALHVIMDIPNLYLESLIGVKLREDIFEKEHIPKFYANKMTDLYYKKNSGGDFLKIPAYERHPWNDIIGKKRTPGAFIAGRTKCHKLGRVVYKFIRMGYVSYLFYFGPISVLIL